MTIKEEKREEKVELLWSKGMPFQAEEASRKQPNKKAQRRRLLCVSRRKIHRPLCTVRFILHAVTSVICRNAIRNGRGVFVCGRGKS
jgi:transposase